MKNQLVQMSHVAVLLTVVLHIDSSYADERVKQFEQHVRPTLVHHCVQCHGATKQEGGLRLDSLEHILAGGDSGPALESGAPTESLLLEALRYESYEMPPTGQLPESVAAQFEAWIGQGAYWPEHAAELRAETGSISAEDRAWWAFQPVQSVEPPTVENPDWCRNEVDQFVLERMAAANITPAPRANPRTLVRRLYFDLIGLPPTPAETEQYLADDSPTAWSQLVERLLDDPRYGEHWGRFWLDLVRYAESDGWNQDAYRPHIWRYRDYVVDAFNADKPYADFVREQLAGDEIDEDNPSHLAAAGFLRLGIYEYNQRDSRGLWNDIANETTDVVGDVFLGVSMSCARCHDHKFDPIPQLDYFKLRAFFEPMVWRDDLVAATSAELESHKQALRPWNTATEKVRAKIDMLLEPYYASKWESTVDKFPLDIQACYHMPVDQRTSWQQQMAYLVERQFLEEGGGPLKSMSKADKLKHDELLAELAKFDALKPPDLPPLMTATDFDGLISPTRIPEQQSVKVAPGFLAVMTDPAPAAQPDPALTQHAPSSRFVSSPAASVVTPRATKVGTSGRRTQLARWIGDPRNPLTQRVIVNRIWQQHFGNGLVDTPSDFGTQGSRPTHPALLDWLTGVFIDSGGSFKQLHRLVLNSAAWQQSATHPDAEANQRIDPSEQLLWRAPIRRLQAEQIRDAMLQASGELDQKIGGPSVAPEKPRRGIYVKSLRNQSDTFMHGFDLANGLKSVAVRDSTTTPTQALLLINGEYTLKRAEHFADRLQALQSHPHSSQQDRLPELLQQAFQLAWGRPPTARELDRSLQFTTEEAGEGERAFSAERFVDFCHVLFNSSQFLYVE